MSNGAWGWWLTVERSLVVAGAWAKARGDAAAWKAASDALDELDALRYAAYKSKQLTPPGRAWSSETRKYDKFSRGSGQLCKMHKGGAVLTINGVAVTIKRASYGFPGWVWSFVVDGHEYGVASWAAAPTADAAMLRAIAQLDQVTGYAAR